MQVKEINELLKFSFENLGTSITFVIGVTAFLLFYIHYTYNKLLKSKDDEISRLTKEKDKLQDTLIAQLKKYRKGE